MTYTQVFGGQTTYPSQLTLLKVALAADTQLYWPTDAQPGVPVVADIIQADPTGAGFAFLMPDARSGSSGISVLFHNVGADTFSVEDVGGNTILSVASGEAWQLYLDDNTTANGVWQIFEFGAGTSTANAAGLAGAGLKAITTTLNVKVLPTLSAVTPRSLVNGDRATLQIWTGGVGAWALPAPATVGTDWFVMIRNAGTGSLTVTPAAGLIDGAASLVFAPTSSAILISDGTNYYTVGFSSASDTNFDYIAINVGGTGDYTLAGIELNRISYRFTGTLTGNRNVIVPITIQEYWVVNDTAGAFTLTVKTAAGTGIVVPAGQSRLLFCNGTDVLAGNLGTSFSEPILGTLGVAYGGTGLVTVAQGDLIYASAADVFAALAKDASASRYLSNTGASNGPAWSLINLLNGVSNQLPVANGGIALTAVAQGDILYGSASDVYSRLAKNTSATRYLSNTGASNNPAWSLINAANGLSGIISLANLQESGSFLATLTGFTTTVQGTVYWTRIGGWISLFTDTAITGTSNATTMTMTGIPVGVYPSTIAHTGMCWVTDNGATAIAGWGVGIGVIQFFKDQGDGSMGNFTNLGTKGLRNDWMVSYQLFGGP